MQIFVPNGLYLQAGIKVTIDEQTPLQVPYVVCLSNGCLAGIVAEPDLVSRLESGRSLRLELVNANMIGIYSSLPLEEFGNVHRGEPAQILEQSLHEQEPNDAGGEMR